MAVLKHRGAGPARGGAVAVLSDTVDLVTPSVGLLVGVAGNVKVTFVDGTVDTLPALLAGVVYPLAVSRIWSTGTTATGIHVLF